MNFFLDSVSGSVDVIGADDSGGVVVSTARSGWLQVRRASFFVYFQAADFLNEGEIAILVVDRTIVLQGAS